MILKLQTVFSVIIISENVFASHAVLVHNKRTLISLLIKLLTENSQYTQPGTGDQTIASFVILIGFQNSCSIK
ncbi:hypothetical protein HOF65_06330 [bacterium]|nr:hypothetical protein [bacterium]MBT3853545.1 hypothetical protein [bacterium]